MRERFERVRDDAQAGAPQRVLFLVPPNNKCAGPLYEIVLMFETWLRREGAREHVEITWSTFEQSYIQAFGPRLHEVVIEPSSPSAAIDGHTERGRHRGRRGRGPLRRRQRARASTT